MPNTPVRAAGEAMPVATLNRRNFLRKAVVAATVGAACATAASAAADRDDDLLETIRSYRQGMSAYAAGLRGRDLDTQEENRLAAETFEPAFYRLAEWDQPASNQRSAVEALRLALDEDAGGFCSSQLVTPLLTAALAYFDSRQMEAF